MILSYSIKDNMFYTLPLEKVKAPNDKCILDYDFMEEKLFPLALKEAKNYSDMFRIIDDWDYMIRFIVVK